MYRYTLVSSYKKTRPQFTAMLCFLWLRNCMDINSCCLSFSLFTVMRLIMDDQFTVRALAALLPHFRHKSMIIRSLCFSYLTAVWEVKNENNSNDVTPGHWPLAFCQILVCSLRQSSMAVKNRLSVKPFDLEFGISIDALYF